MMQSHLDTQCKACSAAALLWKRVHDAGQRETSYAPPEWALRYVKNAFAATAPSSQKHRFFQVPRLVFDSLWHPAPVGLRSSGQGPRQMQYRSDKIEVTLRLEPETGSERVSVTGQISTLPPGREDKTLEGTSVLVTGPSEKVAETAANRFGEFHTSIVAAGELSLQFALPGGNTVVIPLDLSQTTRL